MDITIKLSKKYVIGIYAVFILFIAFTVLLLFMSTSKKNQPLAKQGNDIQKSKESAEILPTKSIKIYITKELSENKTEGFKSNKVIDNRIYNTQLSKNGIPGGRNKNDGIPISDTESSNTAANPIHAGSTLISSSQKTKIFFSKDSTGLTNNALKKLGVIAEFLKQYPESEIDIDGYGDLINSSRYNTKLSEIRADIVKHYLIKQGIAEARIKTFWMRSNYSVREKNNPQEDIIKKYQVEIKLIIRPKGKLKN